MVGSMGMSDGSGGAPANRVPGAANQGGTTLSVRSFLLSPFVPATWRALFAILIGPWITLGQASRCWRMHDNLGRL